MSTSVVADVVKVIAVATPIAVGAVVEAPILLAACVGGGLSPCWSVGRKLHPQTDLGVRPNNSAGFKSDAIASEG